MQELVPLPDDSNQWVDYQELIGYEQMGKSHYISGKLKKEFPLQHQLFQQAERDELIQQLRDETIKKDKGKWTGLLGKVLTKGAELTGITSAVASLLG